MALSEKGLERLIVNLESQGCRIRPTKAGWIIYCPDGTTTITIHRSRPSSRGAEGTIRRRVEAAGLVMPKI